MIRNTTIIVLLALAAAGCKQEKFDPRDLADALSDEFTDAMDFDNGTVMAGENPPADPTGPQMTAFTAPLLVGASVLQTDGTQVGYPYEEDFTITLFGIPGELNVIGALAHVRQANKDDLSPQYIRIEPPTSWDQASGEMTLTARVHQRDRDGTDISGNSFHIALALLVDDAGTEKAGNYVDWNLSTYPADAGDNNVPVCKCRSEFEDGILKYTNVTFLDEDKCSNPPVLAEYDHANADVSPCTLWNQYTSGYNTNSDSIIQMTPDPSYEDLATVNYAAGSRFFPTLSMVEIPEEVAACGLEIECPGDDLYCSADTDCSPPDTLCCNNACTNSRADPDNCGSCGNACTPGAACDNGTCGGGPTCGNVVVLAGWDFESGLTFAQPSILEANVIAQNFSSNTGPVENRIGGGFSWVLEDGWVTEGTFFRCIISAAPGYELRLSLMTFDHSIPNAPGPPTWRISYVQGGPEVDITGADVFAQPLNFKSEFVDIQNLVVDSIQPLEFHWFAEGSDEFWGLDNVMIQCQVCQVP
jgi:hypothetical protein